jgi:hypothetical protein
MDSAQFCDSYIHQNEFDNSPANVLSQVHVTFQSDVL